MFQHPLTNIYNNISLYIHTALTEEKKQIIEQKGYDTFISIMGINTIEVLLGWKRKKNIQVKCCRLSEEYLIFH